MAKKQYDIDIYNFIRSIELNEFTVSEVTRHLLEVHTKMFDKKKNAIQFVYRHLKLLEKQGIVTTQTEKGRKAIVYYWPAQSDGVEEDQILTRAQNTSRHAITKKLQEKIRQYKAEMLTNVGETEAYSEWVDEMPEFAEDVKSHYQHTRDQAKLLLGKVKGFERLLAEYEKRL